MAYEVGAQAHSSGTVRGVCPAMVVSWIAQIAGAGILAQTLFFKFSGAPEAVHIFSTLGVEPWGRWMTGVFELVAAVLLVIPRLATAGAVLALGLMVGAIGSHLGPLGLEVQDDGGLLFGLALAVAGASLVVLALRRRQALAQARASRRVGLRPTIETAPQVSSAPRGPSSKSSPTSCAKRTALGWMIPPSSRRASR